MPPTRQLRCSRTACRLQQEPEATQRAMGRWRYEREGETKAKRGRAACCSECTAAGRQKTRQGKAGLTRGVPIAVLAALAPRGSSALRRGERGGAGNQAAGRLSCARHGHIKHHVPATAQAAAQGEGATTGTRKVEAVGGLAAAAACKPCRSARVAPSPACRTP